jgi:carbon-monoxide dehydrogenase small subunit
MIRFTLNGKPVQLAVPPGKRLVDVLRTDLGLTGTKVGCEQGECGTCTVVIDGRAMNSCLVLMAQVEGREVLTIEGLEKDGRLHPLQEAFISAGAVQCGFCTPGFLMSAYALFLRNPHPTREDIVKAISGNLCRCTGYKKIIEAIEQGIQMEAK